MNWEDFRIKITKTPNGYDVTMYLDTDYEFGLDEFKDFIDKNAPFHIGEYIGNKYPNLKIRTVKIMSGSLVIATIVLNSGMTSAYGSELDNSSSLGNVTVLSTALGVYGNQQIKIKMGDYHIIAPEEPIIINGRVLVPARAISESLGADVAWDQKTRKVTITKGNIKTELFTNKNLAFVNGVQTELDVAPIILNGTTLVPIRFVSESLNIDVDWDASNKSVLIDYADNIVVEYSVQKGNTLSGIAKKFGTTENNLRAWNNLKGDVLYVGQFLRVASPYLEYNKELAQAQVIHPYQFNEVLGYTVRDYPTQTSSLNSLKNYNAKITEISTFTNKVELDGSLTCAYNQNDVVSYAKGKNMQAFMLVHNAGSGSFSKELGQKVLADPVVRAKLVQNIYNEMKSKGYSGVEIDFEALPQSSRDNYSSFLRELKAKIAPEGYKLAVAVPPKAEDNPLSYDGAYDYKSIGQICDRVLIMTYDQHWSSGLPGPIASVDWVDGIMGFAAKTIPKEKILMGVASYGYDWPAQGGVGKAVTAKDINNLIATYGGEVLWNNTAKSPYYKYVDKNNVERIVWFENAYSTQFKFDIAKKYGINGIGMWRLGYESDDFWKGVATRS